MTRNEQIRRAAAAVNAYEWVAPPKGVNPQRWAAMVRSIIVRGLPN